MRLRMRRDHLSLGAGMLGILFLGIMLFSHPSLAVAFLFMSLPGLLASVLIVKEGISFTERIILSFPLTALFLIPIRALAYMGIPINRLVIILCLFILPAVLSLFDFRGVCTRLCSQFCIG